MNNESIEFNLFDECVTFTNCDVEVWRNSITGQESWGWRKTSETEEIRDE